MRDVLSRQNSDCPRPVWHVFDRQVHRGTFPNDWNIVPFKSPSVPILVLLDATSVRTVEQVTETSTSIRMLQQ